MSPRRNSSPHLAAARRGGDLNQAMDGEGDPSIGTPMEVAYWLQVYTEILTMEEKVLVRVHDLMATQSPAARREVELTNLPVIESQVERFRERLGYWRARRVELDEAGRQE